MDAKYGYDQDYGYEHGDDEFNAMVKDEMERLERQVRENVDQYDSGPYDSEDYNGHEATSNSVNSPRGRSGMANEEPTRLNSRGAAKPSGVNSIGSSEQTYAEKRAKQAQYVEQMRGDQYAEGPSRNRAPIRRPSHGIDSEPPSPYGVSAVGHTELTLAEKKAKQTQYLKQLQNDKQYSEVIPTPTRAPFQRREVDDISGPDLFSGMGRVESHNRNGRSQHTNASRQVDAAPDIFSGIGQGDARNRARSQNTNVAPRYVEEASPDIFSSMGQGDSRSRSHINGPRYDAESETTSNYSRQQDKPRSSNSQQQQPSSFMNQIGNSEMDTNGKRAQNKEYARLLADQRQQDELRKEQDDVMYGSSTSARSRSRSTPKGRSGVGVGVGAGSGVDYQSGGNASPFMPGSSASHDLISKQQRQQEYNRQLKEQQENKIQSDQLITGAGGRNSSFRRNDSTNNVNVNPNESDSGGLFSKLGGKDRPASAGRRRIVPANTNGNIIGQGFGMVDEASAKREQQEKYRKQLQNDAQGQVQGQGHIPSRSNSNNTNGNGNNYQSAHEINYDDESYGYGGSGDAAPSPRYSKQSEDYALGELIRQNSYKDNLPSGPSQGQGQGSGYGQGARSDSYGNYGRQQQQPLRQLGGGGGGKSSYAAASAIPSSSYGNANTNAPSSSLSNGYGTGLNIGGMDMDSVQDERAKKREQQLKYAQAIGQSAAMPAVDNRNDSGSGNRHGRDNYQMDQLTDQYRNPAASAVAPQQPQPRTDYRGRGNSSGGGTSGFRLG